MICKQEKGHTDLEESGMDHQSGANNLSGLISVFTSQEKVEEKEMESIPVPKGKNLKESTFQLRNHNVSVCVFP